MKPTKRNETKHECCRGLSDPLSSFLLGGFENEKVRNDASGLEGRGDASERRRLIIALSQRLSSAVPQFRSSARSCAPQARKGAPIFCRACARRAAGDGVPLSGASTPLRAFSSWTWKQNRQLRQLGNNRAFAFTTLCAFLS